MDGRYVLTNFSDVVMNIQFQRQENVKQKLTTDKQKYLISFPAFYILDTEITGNNVVSN